MRQEAISRANVAGVEFIKMWMTDVDFLGIEEPISGRGEFFIVYRHGDGSLRVACIPPAGSDYAPCFFGSLHHFAMVAAARGSEYKNERTALWCDVDVKKKYNDIVSRYE
jgi:hypothetical protein